MMAERLDPTAPRVRGTWRDAEPMARHSTWRCGGTAAHYFEPADRDDLVDFLRQRVAGQALLWIGFGSNLLVRDGGLEETVIATAPGLSSLAWEAPDLLYAECGVACAKLAREAAARGRGGLEFLAGIPGTLGGALAMNAGALGSETWCHVEAVETVDGDGRVQRRAAAEYQPHYRGVEGPAGWFLAAWLRLPQTLAAADGARRIREVLARRSATQPTGKATCGSVFMNPPGDYAGRLVEACGLKGLRVGGAEVSTLHANFIVNDGSASAADIEALIERIRETVRQRTGVELVSEVHVVGRHGAEADA